jgi:hypothetical protein
VFDTIAQAKASATPIDGKWQVASPARASILNELGFMNATWHRMVAKLI